MTNSFYAIEMENDLLLVLDDWFPLSTRDNVFSNWAIHFRCHAIDSAQHRVDDEVEEHPVQSTIRRWVWSSKRRWWLTWLLCNNSFSKSPRICMVVVLAWSRSRMAFCTCSLTVSEAWLRSISCRWIRFFHSSRSEASEVFSLANRSMVNSYCKHFSSTCRI